MLKYSIGIDISKSDFHACLSSIDSTQHVKVLRSGKFQNKRAGFESLIKWVKLTCKDPAIPIHFIMEATGVYYENCALYMFTAGNKVSVVLPNRAKKYIAALGVKTKNDKADSKALSRMGAEQALDPWEPMGMFFYELRSLTRFYQSLQESLTVYNNQLEAVQCGMHPNKEIIRRLKKMMDQLDKQVEEIRKCISEHIASDELVARKVKDLAAIRGVGELSVAVVVAETNGFLLFKTASQLVSYAGYDVVENQSGKRVGKTKISKKGNARIRRALHMPSLCVVKYNEDVFKKFYERTVERHGIKMKSYVAVQKKLLTLFYTLWKKNERFNPEYHLNNTTGEKEAEYSSQVSFAKA